MYTQSPNIAAVINNREFKRALAKYKTDRPASIEIINTLCAQYGVEMCVFYMNEPKFVLVNGSARYVVNV